MYLLGYDIGSSSVKASIIDSESGVCLSSAFYPKNEAPILSPHQGWAEQNPSDWWEYLRQATSAVLSSSQVDPSMIGSIGISYQMHGLVCIDKDGKVLRPAIIWCDSRAVPYGEAAFKMIGREECLSTVLNSPGNFTASKLAWVKDNEPEIYGKIHKVMLPGDYIAYRLTGEISTTIPGLSEGILWDFRENRICGTVLDSLGIDSALIPDIVPTFAEQGRVTRAAAAELGLAAGTPVSYRAGDQPNNALSLGVLEPGEIASTAGTSGVVYGVSDKVASDPLSRVNSFAHVNHSAGHPRLGVLLCINGTGILNSWARRNIAPDGISYAEMNELASTAPAGSRGLLVYPFGNGAERMLSNTAPGCSLRGIDFNIHDRSCILRACQEGIVFAFRHGISIMEQMGVKVDNIHAGMANMFLSPIFREALSCTTGATIDLYDTDGAAGAARGGGIGAGIYSSAAEAFSTLKRIGTIEPDSRMSRIYADCYENWKQNI